MGWQLLIESLLPPSLTGTTLVINQSSGIADSLSDLEKIHIKYSTTHSAFLLRNAFGRPSGPVDFFMFSDNSSDTILCSDMKLHALDLSSLGMVFDSLISIVKTV